MPTYYGPTVGPNFGTSASSSSGTGGGTLVWTNPSDALAEGGNAAYVLKTASIVQTQYLKISNFGFSIPSDSTVYGIIIEAKLKKYNSTSNVTVGPCATSKNGTTFDGYYGSTGDKVLTDNYQWIELGSRHYNSGSFTATDINSSNFAVGLSLYINSIAATGAYCDAIRVTIYYFKGNLYSQTKTCGNLIDTAGTFDPDTISNIYVPNDGNVDEETGDITGYAHCVSPVFIVNNFGFTIPTDKVILGIQFDYVGFGRDDQSNDCDSIRINDSSSDTGIDYYYDMRAPYADSDYHVHSTIGGTVDNWKLDLNTLGPAFFNSNSFGVNASFTGASDALYFDQVDCTVYYTDPQNASPSPPPPPNSLTVSRRRRRMFPTAKNRIFKILS